MPGQMFDTDLLYFCRQRGVVKCSGGVGGNITILHQSSNVSTQKHSSASDALFMF